MTALVSAVIVPPCTAVTRLRSADNAQRLDPCMTRCPVVIYSRPIQSTDADSWTTRAQWTGKILTWVGRGGPDTRGWAGGNDYEPQTICTCIAVLTNLHWGHKVLLDCSVLCHNLLAYLLPM